MEIKIKSLFTGKSKDYDTKTKRLKTAYKKEIQKEIYITKDGVKYDEQADKKNHGGLDRAVCVYLENSYKFLEDKYSIKLNQCSFGENITLQNCFESDVFIGDVFSCNETLLEVSQPRIPCFVISYITKVENFTKNLVEDCKTGFLLRVIKEGSVLQTDSFKLEKRVNNKFSIEYISKCYLEPEKYKNEIEELLEEKSLADAYKGALKNRLENCISGIEEFQKDII